LADLVTQDLPTGSVDVTGARQQRRRLRRQIVPTTRRARSLNRAEGVTLG